MPFRPITLTSGPTNASGSGFRPLKLNGDAGGQNNNQPAAKPQTPLASDSSPSFLKNFFTSMKDVSTGEVKNVISGARSIASFLQKVGQGVMARASDPLAGSDKLQTDIKRISGKYGAPSLDDSTPEGKGVSTMLQPSNTGEKVGNVVADAGVLASGFAGGTAESLLAKGKSLLTGGGAEKDTAKLTELISPKTTVKEAKLAETEGRLVKGQQPTLFKSGTADEILPSKKVIQATATIQREIPNAAKMSEPELYTALDNKTTEIAAKLQPEMKKVPVLNDTVQKITDDWAALKKTQLDDPYFSKDTNVEKLQKNFEDNFLKKSKSENMDDLWQTRKQYDASVPNNVKSANQLSSQSLQDQRKIWLQNRSILNNAINDTANGLGDTSKQAFSDMTDMYSAQQNILTKAKVDTKIQPSKLKQFFQSTPGKVIKYSTEAVIGDKALKSLSGGKYGF